MTSSPVEAAPSWASILHTVWVRQASRSRCCVSSGRDGSLVRGTFPMRAFATGRDVSSGRDVSTGRDKLSVDDGAPLDGEETSADRLPCSALSYQNAAMASS